MSANTLTALDNGGDEYDRHGYYTLREAQLVTLGFGEIEIRHLGRGAIDMGDIALNRLPVSKEYGLN